jgi:hypothetical protein
MALFARTFGHARLSLRQGGQTGPLRLNAARFVNLAPAPDLHSLHAWLHATLASVSKKSGLALFIRYALSRWAALTRYCDDGRIEIDNNAAER